jgi:multiple sugar transport system substrate-binding protein
MKKPFFIYFSVLIVLTVIAWHQIPRSSSDGKVSLIWASDDNPVRRNQIDLFNSSQENVHLTLDPSNNTIEKIITQSIAGVGPDIFDIYGRYSLQSFIESGIAMDITELAEQNGFDRKNLWPASALSISWDGKQYAFPAQISESVLFYNKRIFDQANIPYPPTGWTWEQFIDTAKRLTRKSSDGKRYETFGAITLDWYESVLQAGGTMYSPDGLRCTLDSPFAIEATRYYYDLMHTYHILPTTEDLANLAGEGGWGGKETGNFTLFGEERVAMIRAGRWAFVAFNRYPKLKNAIGVCRIPYKRKNVSLVWTRAVALNSNSTHKEKTISFFKFLASPTYQTAGLISGDSIPLNPKLALNRSESPYKKFDDVFIEAIKNGVVAEVSPYVNPVEAYKIMLTQIEFVTSKLKTPEQACLEMTKLVNRKIYQNLVKYKKYQNLYLKQTGKPFDPDDSFWKDYR